MIYNERAELVESKTSGETYPQNAKDMPQKAMAAVLLYFQEVFQENYLRKGILAAR